jgi:hypothetical protein
VSSIGQIGARHLGRLEIAIYPLTSWTPYEVVATDGASGLYGCLKTTITIARKTETAVWVDEPLNQTKPECLRAEGKIRKYSVEDPPFWKRLRHK